MYIYKNMTTLHNGSKRNTRGNVIPWWQK